MSSWKKRKRLIIIVVLAGVVTFNLLAWMHACTMMNFSTTAAEVKKPGDLSLLEKIKVLLVGVRIPRPENKENPANWGLNFQTLYFTGHAGHKLEAWYIPFPGAKKMILLFHGYGAAKSQQLPAAAAFYKMGYATFLVDFYGSGGSDGNSTSIGFYEAEDVTAAFKYASKTWPDNDFILYGVSMGSVAILRAIYRDHLTPSALIIESPFNSLLATVKNRFKVMGLPSFPASQALLFWGSVQQGFNAFRHNPAQYAKAVTCPVLVLHGEADKMVSNEDIKQVFENLAGPRYFKSYPGIGHQLKIKHYPGKWRKDIFQFIDLDFSRQDKGNSNLDKKVKKFLENHRGQWYDMNVPASDGKVLFDLIVKHKYKKALEIGTSTGHSAIWIAWALSKTGGKLVTIEIDESRYKEAVANFKEAGLWEYIDARLADAHQLVPQLKGPFDFVFCDADKGWYKNYFVAVLPKLEVGGCYTAHNVSMRFGYSMRGIKEFLDHVKSLDNVDTTIVNPSYSGISLSYKRSNK